MPPIRTFSPTLNKFGPSQPQQESFRSPLDRHHRPLSNRNIPGVRRNHVGQHPQHTNKSINYIEEKEPTIIRKPPPHRHSPPWSASTNLTHLPNAAPGAGQALPLPTEAVATPPNIRTTDRARCERRGQTPHHHHRCINVDRKHHGPPAHRP